MASQLRLHAGQGGVVLLGQGQVQRGDVLGAVVRVGGTGDRQDGWVAPSCRATVVTGLSTCVCLPIAIGKKARKAMPLAAAPGLLVAERAPDTTVDCGRSERVAFLVDGLA